jgi:hypothetical protein
VARDLNSAAAIYCRLIGDSDVSVRAEALAGLARVYRKLKKDDAALRAYDRLSATAALVGGLPADLVAPVGRAAVFEEIHLNEDLRKEAEQFTAELTSGRWRLTKSEYTFYLSQATNWGGGATSTPVADSDAIAQAEAVLWLAENASVTQMSTRRFLRVDGGPVLILSRTGPGVVTATVAGPRYLASLCHSALIESSLECTLSDAEGRALIGPAPPARSVATRPAAASKLPWTVHVFSPAHEVVAGASAQRRLLWWVSAVLALVWLTGAAFIVRAISREARVAQLQSDFVAAVSHRNCLPSGDAL